MCTERSDITEINVNDHTNTSFLTGTHWVREIVTLLLNHTSTVTGESKIKEMIEAFPTSRIADLPSPRLLNSHLRIRYLPQVNIFSIPDGWMGGWMDRWMDGWMDGRIDGSVDDSIDFDLLIDRHIDR